jgi:hypothetical protein
MMPSPVRVQRQLADGMMIVIHEPSVADAGQPGIGGKRHDNATLQC